MRCRLGRSQAGLLRSGSAEGCFVPDDQIQSLRELARLRARLSQSDLCRRLQLAGVIVERDVISRIENGGRFVADFEVVVIADVLEVSVDWLLGKE